MTRQAPTPPPTTPPSGEPVILVTNDDGIHAPGLHALADALQPLGEVWILAPDGDRSAVSHSFTMNRPLRVKTVAPRTVILDGTPADCVLFAMHGYLERKPSLVVSGINNGSNMGADTIYSGTVAAAREAHLCGGLGIGVSLERYFERGAEAYDFSAAAQVARLLAERVLANGLPQQTFLNVNVPHVPWDELRGVEITRLGQRVYRDVIVKREDPNGNPYYWVGGEPPTWVPEEGTDFQAVQEDKVSITPLGQDRTRHDAIRELDDWKLKLNSKE